MDTSTRIIGIIGANGAGKTTFLRRRAANSSSVALSLSLMETELFGRTAQDHLRVVQRGWQRLDAEAVESLLDFPLATRIRDLSIGQRQLLVTATAVAAREPYIFLDEPFNGLDSSQRQKLHTALITLVSSTDAPEEILISSHHASDLATIASEIITLRDYHASDAISIDELRDNHPVLRGPNDAIAELTREMPMVRQSSLAGYREVVLAQPLSDSASRRAHQLAIEVNYLNNIELLDAVVAETSRCSEQGDSWPVNTKTKNLKQNNLLLKG